MKKEERRVVRYEESETAKANHEKVYQLEMQSTMDGFWAITVLITIKRWTT